MARKARLGGSLLEGDHPGYQLDGTCHGHGSVCVPRTHFTSMALNLVSFSENGASYSFMLLYKCFILEFIFLLIECKFHCFHTMKFEFSLLFRLLQFVKPFKSVFFVFLVSERNEGSTYSIKRKFLSFE